MNNDPRQDATSPGEGMSAGRHRLPDALAADAAETAAIARQVPADDRLTAIIAPVRDQGQVPSLRDPVDEVKAALDGTPTKTPTPPPPPSTPEPRASAGAGGGAEGVADGLGAAAAGGVAGAGAGRWRSQSL